MDPQPKEYYEPGVQERDNPPHRMNQPLTPTAAALVIGNEILSGKVEEANVAALARTLRSLGVRAPARRRRPGRHRRRSRARCESSRRSRLALHVGRRRPDTRRRHRRGVAKAFGVRVVSSPAMEAMLRAHYKERCTEGHLRMALVPKGASLEVDRRGPLADHPPREHVAPAGRPGGLPDEAPGRRRAHVGQRARAFVSHAVYTKMDEGDLKPLLDRVVARFPTSSSARTRSGTTRRTRRSSPSTARDDARVIAARDAFVATLPAGEPQRIE